MNLLSKKGKTMKKRFIYRKLSVLKKLLMAFMFVSISDILHTGILVEGGGSKIVIVNYSDMKVRVTWTDPSEVVGGDSGIIDSYASSGLTYADSSRIQNVIVAYYKPDGVTLVDTVPFKFSPIKMAQSLYVYGTSSVPITSLTPPDESDYRYPSRYVAWWYENIDMKKNADVDMAIGDEEGVGKKVVLLMMKTDGSNEFIGF